MTRIRVLHVLDTLETGGLERGVTNLIQRMDPARFEHIVCAIRNLGAMAERLPQDRVQVVCLNKETSGFTFEARSLLRHIEQAKPHVVHSRNWGTIDGLLAGWWSRSCALVHSEHGIESVHSQPEPARRRWMRRLVYHLADRVFCVSQQLRDLYARRTGFPIDRIGVIHNGVDTGRFCPDREARYSVRQRFGIDDKEFCIGAIGRLEPVKDLPALLRAAAELPHSCRKWRLIVVGEGSQLPELRQLAGSHPELRDRVCFAGELSDIPAVLNALDVYVLPSLAEGISNSLLEAMATGLPVIASQTGGNPEVAVHGESGLLFPTGDIGQLTRHLVSIIENADMRRQLARQAVERVKTQFSMKAMVTRYEDLYSSVGGSRVSVRSHREKMAGRSSVLSIPGRGDGTARAGVKNE